MRTTYLATEMPLGMGMGIFERTVAARRRLFATGFVSEGLWVRGAASKEGAMATGVMGYQCVSVFLFLPSVYGRGVGGAGVIVVDSSRELTGLFMFATSLGNSSYLTNALVAAPGYRRHSISHSLPAPKMGGVEKGWMVCFRAPALAKGARFIHILLFMFVFC